MNQKNKIADGIRLIRVPEGFDHTTPIFQEPPDQVAETWTHGSMVGGLGWLTQQQDIARSYRRAAATLIEKALDECLSWEIIYPALFLYRHATEVTLKSLFPNSPRQHSLIDLIEQADKQIRLVLCSEEASWVRSRLEEFATIDPQSTAFRYAGSKLHGHFRQDGEWWVDFRHLEQTMEIVLQLLEILSWGELAAEEE